MYTQQGQLPLYNTTKVTAGSTPPLQHNKGQNKVNSPSAKKQRSHLRQVPLKHTKSSELGQPTSPGTHCKGQS